MRIRLPMQEARVRSLVPREDPACAARTEPVLWSPGPWSPCSATKAPLHGSRSTAMKDAPASLNWRKAQRTAKDAQHRLKQMNAVIFLKKKQPWKIKGWSCNGRAASPAGHMRALAVGGDI